LWYEGDEEREEGKGLRVTENPDIKVSSMQRMNYSLNDI